tara:strand:- start:727 stop:942 length:216 start_codon:yes stop_codon:yes gene_type:complete
MNSSLNLEYLSPTGSIGIFVLIIGVIVTVVCLYVFYNVSSDSDSMLDLKRKKEARKIQQEKIARLYPKKNN